jgi:hypothetical protein
VLVKTKKLQPEEVEAGLTSKSLVLRYEMAKNLKFNPTVKQIERGLTDEDPSIRFAFFSRRDITPSLRQMKRGLKDKDDIVREYVLDIYPEWEAKMIKDKYMDGWKNAINGNAHAL